MKRLRWWTSLTASLSIPNISMIFKCVCGSKIRVADSNLGLKVKCPLCSQVLQTRAPMAVSLSETDSPSTEVVQTKKQAVEFTSADSSRQKKVVAAVICTALALILICGIAMMFSNLHSDDGKTIAAQAPEIDNPLVETDGSLTPGLNEVENHKREVEPLQRGDAIDGKNRLANTPIKNDTQLPLEANDLSKTDSKPKSKTAPVSPEKNITTQESNLSQVQEYEDETSDNSPPNLVNKATEYGKTGDPRRRKKNGLADNGKTNPPDFDGSTRYDADNFKAEQYAISLPDEISNVVQGGGGRYLIIHFEEVSKLGIFDTQLEKISGYINLSEEKIHVAAGLKDVIIAYPMSRVLERWDLETLERKFSREYPFVGRINLMEMGAASEGPLLIAHSKTQSMLSKLAFQFFNPKKFQPTSLRTQGTLQNNLFRNRIHVRPSLDGSVFGSWSTDNSILEAIVIDKSVAKFHSVRLAPSFVLPNSDGSKVYTSFGISPPDLIDKRARISNSSALRPSSSARFDYSIQRRSFNGKELKNGSLIIHLAGDPNPFVAIRNIPIPKTLARVQATDKLTVDRMTWFIPPSNSFIISAFGEKKLFICKIDIESVFENSDIDYLYVKSRPPTSIFAGRDFKYQIEVESKLGEVKISLDSAPKGMKISNSGVVKWSVPKKPKALSESIIISVTDKSKQKVFHSFDLEIVTN